MILFYMNYIEMLSCIYFTDVAYSGNLSRYCPHQQTSHIKQKLKQQTRNQTEQNIFV